MSDNTVPVDYANSLMYELEKAFWDERGKGARFRMMNVGQQYYQDNVKPRIQTDVVEDILEQVGCVLQEKGIVAELSYNREERLLKVGVRALYPPPGGGKNACKRCRALHLHPCQPGHPVDRGKTGYPGGSWPRSRWKRGPAS